MHKASHWLTFAGLESTVVLGPGQLKSLDLHLVSLPGHSRNRRVVLVTDHRVGSLYAADLDRTLGAAGYSVLTLNVAPGEGSKSPATAGDLYTALMEFGLQRDGIVVALGGGVVSDLAGFVAATWMRGVEFVICPTTLEADVDACLGGKTALNLPGGKNMVGAFHQPALVVVDPLCLHTLDPRDLRAGLAESVKHALLDSEDFVSWHETQVARVLKLDEAVITELILRNLQFKGQIVARDVEDRTGIRAVLNLGHTLGHAIEDCCNYSLRHGECVALGLLAECRIANSLGLLDERIVTRLRDLLEQLELPTRLAEPIKTGQVLTVLRRDKKGHDGRVRFVLLAGMGQPVMRSDVPETLVCDAVEALMA